MKKLLLVVLLVTFSFGSFRETICESKLVSLEGIQKRMIGAARMGINHDNEKDRARTVYLGIIEYCSDDIAKTVHGSLTDMGIIPKDKV